ncbi:MAG: PhzF family phenazine biosynthesis protein [Planctomycetota bacterium]
MTLPLIQIDAFSEGPFTGNPAAVVPHDGTLDETLMQRIAEENNLSETAFVAPLEPDGCPRFALRWFTPTTEVELCGHATLGAAAALRDLGRTGDADRVAFDTKSGTLIARFAGDLVEIDLPVAEPQRPCPAERLQRALGAPVEVALEHRYALAVLPSEGAVRALAPHRADLEEVGLPVIATAPSTSDDVHFVSRFFAPTLGVFEDPVTGSAHCQLVPYWAERLGSSELVARQISARGGRLVCALDGDRVRLAGGAHVYLRGEICST